jgi:methylmalonyl-CoA/ethylmalonyl-CoA epimerase
MLCSKNLEKQTTFWSEVFGYTQYTNPIVNTRQKVKVVFMKKEGSLTIKLIEPLEDNQNLIDFLKFNDSKFHHICFKCKDLNQGISTLKAKGMRLISPPEPGEAFNNNLIAFLLSTNGINIELIDTDSKAEIIKP